jgi:soluble lytic murein transglycosylase
MTVDQYALMRELQARDLKARGVAASRAPWSRRRRILVWGGTLLALLGALLIVSIQREQQQQDLRSLIRSVAGRHGLDPAFVEAVVFAESSGNPRAVSRAGALGLMQLMVPTATEMAGREPDNPVPRDMLFEPAFNLELGCRYLAHLGKKFDGDPRRILIAYNAGQGRLRRWERTGASTDEILERLVPSETRAYVARVLAFRRTILEDAE